MKLIVDTNILVRAARDDHAEQSPAARALLDKAALLAVPTPTLCEYVWVMRNGYRRPAAEVAASVKALADTDKVVIDREAVAMGLRFMHDGGDFADGAIVAEGRRLGGISLASFDRDAQRLAANAGISVTPI